MSYISDEEREHGRLLLLWTDNQVDLLNAHQSAGRFHPYTCPNRDEDTHNWRHGDLGVLVATRDGWTCPDCDYTQGWAHVTHALPAWEVAFLANPGGEPNVQRLT